MEEGRNKQERREEKKSEEEEEEIRQRRGRRTRVDEGEASKTARPQASWQTRVGHA